MQYRDLFKQLDNCSVVTVRGLETKEITGVALTPDFDLYKTQARSLVNSKQYEYLMNEFVWYLNGELWPDYIAQYAPFWNKIADANGLIQSNYGFQVLYNTIHPGNTTPAEWCRKALEKDLYTRQAIMLYNHDDNIKNTKDFICTQTQQFLFRNEHLDSIVYIRSSDAIRGLSFDIPWWRLMTIIMSNTLHIKPGKLKVFIGSSHVYKEHFTLVKNLAHQPWETFGISCSCNLDDIIKKRGTWNRDNIECLIGINPLHTIHNETGIRDSNE